MKRRILGLALALCLIVGLLPLSVFAEEVASTPAALEHLQMKLDKGNTSSTFYNVENKNLEKPVYIKTAADGLSFDFTATESDYNIAIVQTATSLDITLKDAYMKHTERMNMAFWIRFNGNVNITLIGDNKLEATVENSPAAIYVKATGLTTISGTGTLTANSIGFTSSHKQIDWDGDGAVDYSYDFGCTIISHGDLLIKDATLNLSQTSGSKDPWASNTLRCGGNLTIDGATLNLNSQYGRGIMMGLKRNKYTDPGNLVIKNGAKVNITDASYGIAVGTGTVTIDGANGTDVVIKARTSIFKVTPTLQNIDKSTVLAGKNAEGTDATEYKLEANQAATELLYFSLLHNHTGGTATCTKKAVCTICNEEYGETAAHTYTRTDCSKDSVCSVCNQVVVKAGAHEGGTATCKDKAVCTICKQAYGELGAHTGGTATCVAKAKCDLCKAEYGELGGHAPEADDKDCTTEQKCTLCKTVLVAAKEHKYANSVDKSCENQGCAYVRGSNTPTTPSTNPNTGDISILLTAAVALSSAAGFAGVTVLRKKEN